MNTQPISSENAPRPAILVGGLVIVAVLFAAMFFTGQRQTVLRASSNGLDGLGSVSYTHLTLPTIYSV